MKLARRRRRWSAKAIRRRSPQGTPYTSRRTLLSRGELAFYTVLLRSIEPNCAVSLKTRLADILHCPQELWNAPHGRRLSQKHVDFVLYCPHSGLILAVIELDDSSHLRAARRERDRFVRSALAEAKIPFLQVVAASGYDADSLRYRIQWLLRREKNQPPRS